MNQESRALRRAQEAYERRGEWEHRSPARPGLAGKIIVVAVLGCIVLAAAAVRGNLDAAGAKLFAMMGL